MRRFQKNLLKFKKKLFFSQKKGNHKIDDNLDGVLQRCSLEHYRNIFIKNKVLYEDLPSLTDDILRELIPDQVPRERFKQYIQMHFVQTVQNGWKLDPTLVKFDEFPKIMEVGTYGKINTGKLKVGISAIDIAIKEILVDDVSTNVSNVIKEVTIMSQLRHENVVACYGCWFSDNGRVANIALELCEKGDLYNFRKENQKLDPVTKMDFLLQIAKGVAYIHKSNIVHRDLKPQNVLVAADGKTLKICDFGTSKGVNSVQGTLCGTPAYLSPEQFSGRVIDNPKQIDVFAFGVIAWELWTGLIPYQDLQEEYKNNTFKFLLAVHGNQEKELAKRIITRPAIQNLKQLKDCPQDLLDLIQGCWHQDVEERVPSFEFIVQELKFYKNELEKKLGRKKTKSKK